MRVLLVEDEPQLATRERQALEREGHDVAVAETGRQALELLSSWSPDVVLLDIGLPDVDGRDVVREIRRRSDAAIIIVSGHGEEIERISGLEAGADDYLVKPVSLAELLVRIRTVTRRVQVGTEPATLRHEELELDARSHRTRVDGRELDLTPKEFEILRMLMICNGGVVRREELARAVWGTSARGLRKTIDVHISALRAKLGDEAEHPRHIETVRGIGFRMARLKDEDGSS